MEKTVTMQCPLCLGETSGTPESFQDVRNCPHCRQSVYFVRPQPPKEPEKAAAVEKRPSASPRPGGKKWRLAAAVLALVAAGLAGYGWWGQRRETQAREAAGRALAAQASRQVAAARAVEDPHRRREILEKLAAGFGADNPAGQREVTLALLETLREISRRQQNSLSEQAAKTAAVRAELQMASAAAVRAEESARAVQAEREEDLRQRLRAEETSRRAAEERLREKEKEWDKSRAEMNSRLAALEQKLATLAEKSEDARGVWADIARQNAENRKIVSENAEKNRIAAAAAAAAPQFYFIAPDTSPRSEVNFYTIRNDVWPYSGFWRPWRPVSPIPPRPLPPWRPAKCHPPHPRPGGGARVGGGKTPMPVPAGARGGRRR